MTNQEIKELLEKPIQASCNIDIKAAKKIAFGRINQQKVDFKGVFQLDDCVFEGEVFLRNAN